MYSVCGGVFIDRSSLFQGGTLQTSVCVVVREAEQSWGAVHVRRASRPDSIRFAERCVNVRVCV